VRKPKNLDRYSAMEDSIRGLEDLAADLKAKAEPGMLMRWNINISIWDPKWETQPRGARTVRPQLPKP